MGNRLFLPAFWLRFITVVPVLTAMRVLAHHEAPGMEIDEFADTPLTAAFLHPFTGPDHLLAAAAIGITALVWGRRTGLRSVAAFLLFLTAASTAGRWELPLPRIETGLAVSLMLAGAAVTGSRRVPRSAVPVVAAVTGALQGLAHASAIPAGGQNGWYSLGLALGSGVIALICGLAAAQFRSSRSSPLWPRVAGGALAAFGVSLALSQAPVF